MADFKLITATLGTSESTLYTTPSGKSAIIKMLQVSNISASDYYVTVNIHNGTNSYALAYQVNVPARSAVALLTGDLYLPAGYSLKALGEVADNLVLLASVVEI